MRIIVATVQVPFISGGAEVHTESLVNALKMAGYKVEVVAIPFKWYPSEKILDTMLIARLLDLTESNGKVIDLVIATKFPAYFMPHPNKVLWLLHQYRDAYDLWGTPFCGLSHYPNGLQIRDAIVKADNQVFQECQAIYTISGNVTKRLKKFNQCDSTVVYPPPKNIDLFYCEKDQHYFFFPSRLNPLKRQEMVLKAMTLTHYPMKVVFAGESGDKIYDQSLLQMAEKLDISDRVIFLGRISEAEKIKYYAEATAVIYPPFDEDYGYVTLEGMLSAKPVITCTDSGGPLEFIHHRETGWVAEPTPESLAFAMDQLWENRSWAAELGRAAHTHYHTLNITWSNVIEKLVL